MNAFVLRHLTRLYSALEGDLLLAMVLGEVAHHNVGAHLLRQGEYDRERLSAMVEEHGAALLTPVNAFSISAATGIPYETVRRKVAALVRRGWLERDSRRNLFMTVAAARDLRELTNVAIADFLHVVDEINAGPPQPPEDGPQRLRPRKH